MEAQEIKARLIKKIETANEAQLLQLATILNSFDKEQDDWFYDLPAPLQELLTESMKQAYEGKTFSNEEVMRETRKKYGIKKIMDSANPPQAIKDLLEIAKKQAANGQTLSNEKVKELIKNKYGFLIK